MKSVYSSTGDSLYDFFIPVTAWCWSKLGVGSIVFVPSNRTKTLSFSMSYVNKMNISLSFHEVVCPKHKEATFMQCGRLYAACLDLPEDEVLVTSDIDMLVFKKPPHEEMFWSGLTIFGGDLVPPKQYPMCYASGTVRDWRVVMNIKNKNYQQCLDELLEHIECESFRGNYWGKDQETLYNQADETAVVLQRARPGTQFASNRIDRDDAYFMDRLSPDIVDYHMHRPGFLDENFEKILSVIQYFYPDENLDWMREYQKQYKALL